MRWKEKARLEKSGPLKANVGTTVALVGTGSGSRIILRLLPSVHSITVSRFKLDLWQVQEITERLVISRITLSVRHISGF